MTRGSWLPALMAIGIGSASGSTRAEESPTPPRADGAQTAIRVAGGVTFLGPVGLGVELSQKLTPHFAVDASASYEDFQHSHNGIGVDALARWFPWAGVHALGLGVGSAFVAAKEYGSIGFVQGEISYEYRRPRAFSFLVAGGPQIALNSSGRATCPDTGFLACFLWKDQYAAGDIGAHLRLAIGTAF